MKNALLVSLNVSQYVNARNDDGITKEVMVAHQLMGKSGRWVKLKLNPDALEGVRKAEGRARADHYRLTLPWEDGKRLLPLALMAKYQAEMSARAVEFKAAVDAFVADYPARVEESKLMHGKKWNQDDYPKPEVVGALFSFRTEFAAVPAENHLAEIVTGDALEQMKAGLVSANESRIAGAEASLWERLLTPVRDLASKLSDPDQTFRDSLVGNVREILDLAPSFNLTGKPVLDTAVAEIRTKLATLDPETLRTNMPARSAAVRAAASIIQQFGAVGVRKIA